MLHYDDLVTLNSAYGSGVFKRYIRIESRQKNAIVAALSDDCHAFVIQFNVVNGKLANLVGHWERRPNSSCSGAEVAIQEAEGYGISPDIFGLKQTLDAKQHCTHFFDLVSFAAVHAFCKREDRTYKVEVTDELDRVSAIRVYTNGKLRHNAKIRNGRFSSPRYLSDAPLGQGFTAWARRALSLERREIAFMMQMAYFVSNSRRLDLNTMAGRPARNIGPPVGSCYGLQPERVDDSIRLASQRELGNDAEAIFRSLITLIERG